MILDLVLEWIALITKTIKFFQTTQPTRAENPALAEALGHFAAAKAAIKKAKRK